MKTKREGLTPWREFVRKKWDIASRADAGEDLTIYHEKVKGRVFKIEANRTAEDGIGGSIFRDQQKTIEMLTQNDRVTIKFRGQSGFSDGVGCRFYDLVAVDL